MPNFILVSSNSDKKTYVRNVQCWSVLVGRAVNISNSFYYRSLRILLPHLSGVIVFLAGFLRRRRLHCL